MCDDAIRNCWDARNDAMKRYFLTLALAVATTFANAQGTIQLANNAGTRFYIGRFNPAPGALYFGAFVGTSADSLSSQPIGNLGTNTPTAGLINSPNGNAHQLPGFWPDSIVFIQIRMWESRFGSDWRAAQQGGVFGQTGVRSVLLGPASGPGTVIWSATDLTKFQGIVIPELSTTILGGLALGGLLVFRRHKRII